MCLAQGPHCSDAGEARTRGPSVSSQALYHWATALTAFSWIRHIDCYVTTLEMQLRIWGFRTQVLKIPFVTKSGF